MLTIQEFVRKIGENLFEMRKNLSVDTELDSLEGWDSVGRLGIVVLFLELFGQSISTKTLKECKTIGDIIDLAKEKPVA